MKFTYKAKKGLEKVVEGVIEAGSRDEALHKLFAEGLFPVSVEAEAVKLSPDKPEVKKKAEKRFILKFTRRITPAQTLIFTRKLTTLIRANVELLSALRIVHEQTDNPLLQEVILEIYNETREGKAFSRSLERFPAVFSSLFVNIIRSGEASGALASALEQITEFMAREGNLRRKVSAALAYPSVLLFVGITSVFILINFVIPRLRSIFEGLGKELPFFTRIILQVSTVSRQSWWVVLGVIFLVFFILYSQRANPLFRRMLRTIKMQIPIVNRVIKNQELSYFSRSLELLLKSGVPALRSLKIVTAGLEDVRLKKELTQACEEISSGGSIAGSMEHISGLPSFFVKMIAVGEESGRLSEVLSEVSASYTQEIEADISLISSLLEPILILVMGVILGAIVLSMLLPMFQITQMVG